MKADLKAKWVAQFIANVVRDVCDLPDRTSPDDWPEACLVTGDELAMILEERIAEIADEIERLVPVEG